MTSCCWGIYRERAHSPGREGDDAEILRLTGKYLEARGYQVDLKDAEDLGAPATVRPQSVFLMCEREAALATLAAWEADGVRLVNRPDAVLATYRARMIRQLGDARVPFIESRLVPTDAGRIDDAALPVWIKRADVHNTQDGDVAFAETAGAVADALGALRRRGIAGAVLQPHVPGDLIKFYGVGHDEGDEPRWFRWFYHKDQALAGHPFDPQALAALSRRAAAALGLEVYGGDAIATPAGDLVLLDLNAWPSFALYRDEAAPVIAAYLARQFGGGRS